MELQDISLEDLPLWEQMQCDPVMMAELGGPHPREKIPNILKNVLSYVESGRAWAYKIILDEQAVGSIGIWESDYEGQPINEITWMVLPAYQGRGICSQAVRAVLDKAHMEGRWDVIHAFTGVNNAPSNAVCRKAGFSMLEVCDVDYADRILHCNHWRIDVNAPDPA